MAQVGQFSVSSSQSLIQTSALCHSTVGLFNDSQGTSYFILVGRSISLVMEVNSEALEGLKILGDSTLVPDSVFGSLADNCFNYAVGLIANDDFKGTIVYFIGPPISDVFRKFAFSVFIMIFFLFQFSECIKCFLLFGH